MDFELELEDPIVLLATLRSAAVAGKAPILRAELDVFINRLRLSFEITWDYF